MRNLDNQEELDDLYHGEDGYLLHQTPIQPAQIQTTSIQPTLAPNSPIPAINLPYISPPPPCILQSSLPNSFTFPSYPQIQPYLPAQKPFSLQPIEPTEHLQTGLEFKRYDELEFDLLKIQILNDNKLFENYDNFQKKILNYSKKYLQTTAFLRNVRDLNFILTNKLIESLGINEFFFRKFIQKNPDKTANNNLIKEKIVNNRDKIKKLLAKSGGFGFQSFNLEKIIPNEEKFDEYIDVLSQDEVLEKLAELRDLFRMQNLSDLLITSNSSESMSSRIGFLYENRRQIFELIIVDNSQGLTSNICKSIGKSNKKISDSFKVVKKLKEHKFTVDDDGKKNLFWMIFSCCEFGDFEKSAVLIIDNIDLITKLVSPNPTKFSYGQKQIIKCQNISEIISKHPDEAESILKKIDEIYDKMAIKDEKNSKIYDKIFKNNFNMFLDFILDENSDHKLSIFSKIVKNLATEVGINIARFCEVIKQITQDPSIDPQSDDFLKIIEKKFSDASVGASFAPSAITGKRKCPEGRAGLGFKLDDSRPMEGKTFRALS